MAVMKLIVLVLAALLLSQVALAADQGEAAAHYTLGFMYANGFQGVPQNYKEGVKWYRKAADQSYGSAQFNWD